MVTTEERTLSDLLDQAVETMPRIKKAVFEWRSNYVPGYRDAVLLELQNKLSMEQSVIEMELKVPFGSDEFDPAETKIELDVDNLERILELIIKYLPTIFEIIMKFISGFGVVVLVLSLLGTSSYATDLNPLSKAEIKVSSTEVDYSYLAKKEDIPDLLMIDDRDEEMDDIIRRLTALENAVFPKASSTAKTKTITKRVLKGYKLEGCAEGNCVRVPQYEYITEEVPIESSAVVTETIVESSPMVTYSSSNACPDCGRTDCPNFMQSNGYGADGRIRTKDFAGREVPNIMGTSGARTRNGSPYFQFNENNTVYRIAPIRTFWRKALAPFF